MSSNDTNIPTPRAGAAKHGEIRLRTFSVTIPTVDGKAILKRVPVKNVPMEWDENVQDWIIPSSGLNMIEAVKATHIIKVLRGENRKLERELAQAKAELFQCQSDRQREHDLRVKFAGEIENLERDLAAARKDSERLRLVFNGLLITTLDTMNRDKIVHEFGELGLSNYESAKAAMEGGER